MAQASSESAYLPSLSACLSGEKQLISWRAAYQALCDSDGPFASNPDEQKQAHVQQFLSDKDTKQILSRPLQPFEPPSSATKKEFETATAPIKVTPSDTFSSIVDDAQWLSQQLKVSELSALRLALLEWQRSSESQLCNGLTEEEVTTVQQAAGSTGFGSSISFSKSTANFAASLRSTTPSGNPISVEKRRKCLVELFLSEKLFILKTSEILVRSSKSAYTNAPDWIKEIGSSIENAPTFWTDQAAAGGTGGGSSSHISKLVAALEARIDRFDDSQTWAPADALDSPDLDGSWRTGQVIEMIHILELLYVQVAGITELHTAQDVATWFQFVSKYGFFQNNFPAWIGAPFISLFQLLISTVTLAVLKLEASLSALESVAQEEISGSLQGKTPSQWFLDSACVRNINTILHHMAAQGPSAASPSILAWTILVQRLRSYTMEIQAEREQMLELQNSTTLPIVFEEPLRLIIESSEELLNEENVDQDPLERLARICLGHAGFFETVSAFVSLLSSAYGTRADRSMASQLRMTLLNLMREAAGSLSYSSPLVLSIVEILTEKDAYWDLVEHSKISTLPAMRTLVDDSQVFMPMVVHQAVVRYPREIWPLSKIIRSILPGELGRDADRLIQVLRNAPAFTQSMPVGFTAYVPAEDELSVNRVQLTEDLLLFAYNVNGRLKALPASTLLSPGDDEPIQFVIDAGSKGDVVSVDSSPKVTTWYYDHSALQYLAKLLSTATGRSGCIDTSTKTAVDLDTASEIVGLLSSVLLYAWKIRDSTEANVEEAENALSIIEELNAALYGQDLPSVVFDIFEDALQKIRLRTGPDVPMDLFVNCGQFLYTLTVVHPSKVWSYLSRSRLLDFDDISNSLANGVIGTEAALGRYDFLITLIRLFDALIEDVLATAVVRKENNRALTRFSSPRVTESVSPKVSRRRVVETFVKIFTAVLESLPSWKFSIPAQELEITTRIARAFNSVLHYVYGFDDTAATPSLTESLVPAAEYLIGVYLSQSSNDLPIQPILRVMAAALKSKSFTVYGNDHELQITQTEAVLNFCITVLRVGVQLDKPTSHLETRLFKALPLVTRLYVSADTYQPLVVKLLTVMVESAGKSVEEPPSLLGHLGPETAKSFLAVLSLRGKPLNSAPVEKELWTLLSAIIKNRQQWLSIYMLTGTTPRESIKSREKKPADKNTTSMLATAMDTLKNIKELPTDLTMTLLHFVGIAQDHFTFAMREDAARYQAFKAALVEYLSFFQWDDRPAAQERKSQELRILANITEILAMDIHQQRQMGSSEFVKNFYEHTNVLRSYGVEQPLYNHSLHANLRRNLENAYPGCTPENFKHTSLTATRPGSNYYYDLDFARRALYSRQSRSSAPDQAFIEDFTKANINLSFVESQIMLLKSWKLLAMELSINVLQPRGTGAGDQKTEREKWIKALVKTAGDCLTANTQSTAQHPLFERLTHVRADFAFVLIKKLADAKVKDSDAMNLLYVVWEAIRSCGQDFEAPFDSGDVQYYRTLLRILFLCLRFHSNGLAPAPTRGQTHTKLNVDEDSKLTPVLLEILSTVISKGFRSLSVRLHEDMSAVQSSDFVLLTALLQCVLRVPTVGAPTVQGQIATAFAMNETGRAATTLFTWSDRLALNGDPVYGELAILFLLELSTVPAMAEQLAVDGVLAQLSNANLMEYYRLPNGRGPFDEPFRIFSIWQKGILPLCLNLLYSVGPPVAGEVASFLNQFPAQISHPERALSSRLGPSSRNPRQGQITLGIASEVSSLSLIELILAQYRAQGPAAGILASDIADLNWDKVSVKEEVESWLQGRRGLRERIGAGNDRESELLREKPLDKTVLAETRLEELIVKELQNALHCLTDAALAE